MTEQNATSPSLEPTAHAPSRAGEPPLVVDLDGTLIYSDMLWESLMLFLRLHFLQAWRLPFWLLRGKAGFKHALAEWVQPDPATLPYDRVLVQEIADQRRAGRVIVLATGSQRLLAERIALHLQTIDHVYATDSDVNFTSANKASGLVQRYGDGGFDYIGNARVDIPVWHVARGAYSVGSRPFRLPDGRATERIGDERRPMLPALVKAMRPRQWLKNLLVFVPMLAGHALDASHLLQSLLAFLVFSMCASSAYLLNDALDAPDDRLHPTKCRRPIAAGHLPLSLALFASPLLAFGALALCLVFNPLLGVLLAIYFASTLAYSFRLKRLLMIDIVTLALLYTLRVLGGGAATGITPSFWLLGFSFFIFLSLALLKRYSELYNLNAQGKDKTSGRGYTVDDRTPVAAMGINSGFLSVLVFILYFNSDQVLEQYSTPQFLLPVVPLIVFWLGRLWILAYRGQVNEDPVLYVSKDKVSLMTIAACVALVVTATF